MAQQTAVEWLDEKLQDKMFIQYGYTNGIRKLVIPIDEYIKLKQQAKQMEKEQMKNFFIKGGWSAYSYPMAPDTFKEDYLINEFDKKYGK